MLVGTSCPGTSNSAPLPKVCTTLLAKGTMSAAANRADSASSQVVAALGAGHGRWRPRPPRCSRRSRCRRSWCRRRRCPGPDRKGTSWSGLLTLSGTHAMSQSPVPKMAPLERRSSSALAVTSTPNVLPLLDGELGGGGAAAAQRGVVQEGDGERLAVLGADAVGALRPAGVSSAAAAASASVRGACRRRSHPGRRAARGSPDVVAGSPVPDVMHLRSSARSSAWVSAIRTAGSLAGRPSAWLYHCSPVISAGVSASKQAGASRRCGVGADDAGGVDLAGESAGWRRWSRS